MSTIKPIFGLMREDFVFEGPLPNQSTMAVLYEQKTYDLYWVDKEQTEFNLRPYVYVPPNIADTVTYIKRRPLSRSVPKPLTGPEIDTLLAEEDWGSV